MKKSLLDPEKINVKQISVFKSIIDISEDMIDNIDSINGYTFSYGSEPRFNFDEKICKLRMIVRFDAKDANDNGLNAYGEFGVETVYYIENFEHFLIKEKDESSVDATLGSWLCAIAYSTLRGIILQETQNTLLKGIILPVVDPIRLLPQKADFPQ